MNIYKQIWQESLSYFSYERLQHRSNKLAISWAKNRRFWKLSNFTYVKHFKTDHLLEVWVDNCIALHGAASPDVNELM